MPTSCLLALHFWYRIARDPGRTAEYPKAILERLTEVNPIDLPIPPDAESLAQRFIDEGVLPPRRLEDALHVACALVHELDLLTSWNYRHLANVGKAECFNAIAVLAGVPAGLEIHAPLEILEWQ